MGKSTRSPEERFRAKVNKNGPIPEYRPELGPCWMWRGKPHRYGYGRLYVAGRLVYAHRFAYELLVGPMPDGLEPDHLCRVRLCVKAIEDECGPAHLEPVTHRENMLRGQTIAAMRAAQTHCVNGHEFTEATTYWWKGHRTCKTCGRERAQGYRKARRVALGPVDRRGERGSRAKLTNDQVLAIRASSSPQRETAQLYGVSVSLIGMIRNRKVWTHI